MRHVIRLMFILPVFVFIFLPDISFSAKSQKTALVIGNGAYKSSYLRNPVNDATDIASILKKLGFKVILKTNANQRTMKKSILDFGRKLHKGGVGLFYYAGHAIQVRGINYLIPIGAQIESPSDVEYEAIDAGRILGKMEDAGNGLNIIILDSCRDNPFARSFRTSDKGLARMNAPTGSILAYATAPGSIAADGSGRNGLYTSKLLKYMATPGLEIGRVFRKVRIDVVRASQKKQVPWESSSLIGEFYFNPKRGIAVVQSTNKFDTSLKAQQEQLEKMRKELERLKKESERKKFEEKKQKPEIASVPQAPIFQKDSPDTIIWSDYSKPLNLGRKQIDLSSPLKVRVNIPETFIKKFRKISLVIYSADLDSGVSRYLTINDNKWYKYNFSGLQKDSSDVVKIPTKLLKPGENILKFYSSAVTGTGNDGTIYVLLRLRFNMQKNNISSNPSSTSNQIDSPDTIIWSDYSKPLNLGRKQIDLSSPLKVRVNIPETFIKKFRKISLVIYSADLDSGVSRYLTINDNKWYKYNFSGLQKDSGDVVKIPTKLLKPGENILKFYSSAVTGTGNDGTIYVLLRLRFNMQKNNISSN